MDEKTIGKGTFEIVTPRKELFEDTKEKRQALPRQKRKYNRTFRVTGDDGNVRTYKLGKRVLYSNFRLWPEDVQTAYIKDIVNKYPSITVYAMSIMMQCDPKTINKLNNRLGKIIKIKKPGKLSKHDLAEAKNFYDDFGCKEDAEKQNAIRRNYASKSKNNSDGGIHINSMSMEVSFNIDTDDIVKVLKEHGFSGEVTITIKKNIN